MKQKNIALSVVIVVSVLGYLFYTSSQPSKLDNFAKCLGERGAKFYGAFWCPHCQNQKKLFGSSEKYLPYIECSTPDGKDQFAICKEKNIQGYPTWIFSEESSASGELSLETLSQKTSCQLPK